MIKHIFCDLDGTLYHGGIDDKDAIAIKNIEKKGVRFNVATGRIFTQAHNMTKDKLTINGYYICENGSYIYDKNHNLVFKGTIEDEIVKKIINRFESDNAHLYFKYNGKIVLLDSVEDISEYGKEYIIDKNFLDRDSFDNEIGNIGVRSDNTSELSRIELYLQSEFSEILDIYLSSEYTLNIVPKGVSKRSAIEYVLKILNISIDEIATIGDSPNDINMLEGIKYSFVMSNSRDEVKRSANYIVESVKDAIDKIGEINGVE